MPLGRCQQRCVELSVICVCSEHGSRLQRMKPVIRPTLPTGLPTLVPQPAPPQSKPEPPDPNTVVVQVMQGGKLMINQDRSDWNTLGARLSDIFKERADKLAFVDGAEDVPFADVARAIDIMRDAGIEHVGLIIARENVGKKIL